VTGWLKKELLNAQIELKPFYTQFVQLYEQKLWHQLTVQLENFIKIKPPLKLIDLYLNFVIDWENKMNRITFVQFVALAARQMKDQKQALTFLLEHEEKMKGDKNAQDAYALVKMETAHYKLATGDIDGCKLAIQESEVILDQLPGVHTSINATFYRVSADYYKIILAYPQYYHNALLYLSSVNSDDLEILAKQERSYDLAISALLGEGLYNFGELVNYYKERSDLCRKTLPFFSQSDFLSLFSFFKICEATFFLFFLNRKAICVASDFLYFF
jgi:26S proteasome regulatory subunit N9